jgi:quercetin dioxygenase-like cupin family protein
MADDDGTAAEAGGVEGGDEAHGTLEDIAAAATGESTEPHFVEIWNDYDPSQRFAVIFPVGERMGAKAGTVAYYIVEPGRHTGSHSDNAEEIVFVTEGSGEVFSVGQIETIEPGKFLVFPAGIEHDIYAHGGSALRLLSFYPVPEMISTFQQIVFPMGSSELSSRPPKGPVVQQLDADDLPDDFPFDLAELQETGRAQALVEDGPIGGSAAAPESGADDAGEQGPEDDAAS